METTFWDAIQQLSLMHQLGFGFALFVAFGFEFINGFHDTANAVTTVIYTRTLKPTPAVIFSGFCNFLGVLLGGTAVAFAIVNLLPVDLLIDSSSMRDCDGAVAASGRGHLESGNVVDGTPRIEFPYIDRFDYRGWDGEQSAGDWQPIRWNQLGAGSESRDGVVDFAVDRLLMRRVDDVGDEACFQKPQPVSPSGRRR